MKVENKRLSLNPMITQTSPNKKKFRVVGVEKDASKAPVWVSGTLKHYWIVCIRFIESKTLVKFYFDEFENCVKKEKI